MRKPQIGDTWKLNWFKHKPVKEIGAFFGKWDRNRNTVVPAVMFRHQPKGKTIIVSVRYLFEFGELIKPANNACTRRAKVVAQKVSSKSKKVAKPARG